MSSFWGCGETGRDPPQDLFSQPARQLPGAGRGVVSSLELPGGGRVEERGDGRAAAVRATPKEERRKQTARGKPRVERPGSWQDAEEPRA